MSADVEAQAVVPSVAEEPPKRWLNWWDYPSGRVYPSKQIAEQRALEAVERLLPMRAHDDTLPDYLCALPEGERP